MIWDGSEQMSWRPGGKNEIEEDVEVDSPSGKKRGTNEWWWAVILDLGSFTRRGLVMDCVCPARNFNAGGGHWAHWACAMVACLCSILFKCWISSKEVALTIFRMTRSGFEQLTCQTQSGRSPSLVTSPKVNVSKVKFCVVQRLHELVANSSVGLRLCIKKQNKKKQREVKYDGA